MQVYKNWAILQTEFLNNYYKITKVIMYKILNRPMIKAAYKLWSTTQG